MRREVMVKPASENSKTFDVPNQLEEKGTYTLVIFVPVEKRAAIGSLGVHEFPRGYYAYTGSALGRYALSLRGRIHRHLVKDKKKRWHIDHLLSSDDARLRAVIAAPTKTKMECKINLSLKGKLTARIPVHGFGSSDCKENCGSHLLYLGLDEGVAERIAELYSEKIDAKTYILDIG